MSSPAHERAAPSALAHLSVVEPTRPSADRARSARAEMADLEPFAIEVQQGRRVTIVQPRGQLELATVESLRSALDEAIAETLSAAGGMEHEARLVLDLRGLSFIDSNGLHLLVTLDQRAQRDGFQLTLLAPAAPVHRAIQLCGLDKKLPFAAPAGAVDPEPGEPSPADRASEALRDAS